MKKALLLIACFALTSGLMAQLDPPNFSQLFLEANQLMEEKNWRKSLEAWKDLLNQQPDNANVNFKIGYCYLQLPNQKLEGMSFLEAASANVSKKYDPYDPSEKRAPMEALYYLGLSHHLKYDMETAMIKFETLTDELPVKHQLHQRALREIEMCKEAIYQVNNPKNFVITNVGDVINDETNEYSPVLSLDENTMFFTSRRLRTDSSNANIVEFDTGEHREDVYQSFRGPDGQWTEPELLNINSDQHAASVSVSPDGQTLFVYYDDEGNGQLYQSKLIGETWSDPELLGSDINTDAWETHASISADGKELFFVSDRVIEGSYGGRDIYRCVKLPNDEWSRALNIGPTINTEYEEDAVFLSPDGNTLYFASTGHNSMGGFDIFYSEKGPDGEWATPQNVGYPVNTVDDDVFFYPTATPNRAYYASRKEEGYGLKDIYLIDMPDAPVESDMAVLKGYVIAAEGEELPEDCLVTVTNLKSGEMTEYRPRDRDGAYIAILEPCNQYHIEYFANEEMVHEEDMNIPCESAFNEIEKEIFLLPVELKSETAEVDGEGDGDGEDGGAIVGTGDGEDGDGEGQEGGSGVLFGNIEEPAYNTDRETFVGVDAEGGKAYFERYFLYDLGEYEKSEANFVKFIDAVINMNQNSGKTVEIAVESSASNVPSSRFPSNVELTAHRNAEAARQIREALEAKGMNEGENFAFGEAQKLVQGPKYRKDPWNKAKYEPHQYIKVRAEYKK